MIDGPRTLFRIVPKADEDHLVEAFRSNYEQGRPPRGPENRASAIHMSISLFDRRDVAADLAERTPKLGGHVARVDLEPGIGICVAKTGGPAHWSVWGRPPQLAHCVAEVVGANELDLS